MYKYLILDVIVSGTGIRDQYEDEYIDPESLGISSTLLEKLNHWLSRYKEEFYNGYNNKILIQELDNEGVEISKDIKNELVECKISYFSDANLSKHLI
jgi:hypothetical protein